MDRRDDLFDACGPVLPRNLFPERLDVVESLVALVLSAIGLGDDPRDGAAVAGDDDGLTALNLVENLRKAGFSLRGLNFPHTSFSDWSDRLVKPCSG
jgi:hypothetical protein